MGASASLPLLSSVMDPGLALERSAVAARVPGPARISVASNDTFPLGKHLRNPGFGGGCIVLGDGLKGHCSPW